VLRVTKKLALDLNIIGLLNLQFVVKKGEVYIIEVNPRASRTLPFISKMTNLNLAQMATQTILGEKLNLKNYIHPRPDFYSVKAPIFSFEKITNAEPALGPEMKSTGEVIGKDVSFPLALYKAMLASQIKVKTSGKLFVTISDRYKEESLPIIKDFYEHGFKIYATHGTQEYIQSKLDIKIHLAKRMGEDQDDVAAMIKKRRFDLIINTISKGKKSNTDGKIMRRLAIENKIPCFTSLDTAKAYTDVINHLSPKIHATRLGDL
jgi:carbamoyl-phosphate synthase large subunit